MKYAASGVQGVFLLSHKIQRQKNKRLLSIGIRSNNYLA